MSNGKRRWILSGGLASGKSVVARLLEHHGLVTIDSDSIGHEILEPGGPAFDQVSATWPEVVVEGHIDRSALAAIVFGDSAELARLVAVSHPLIFGIINDRVEAIDGVVVVEMPVLKSLVGEWSRLIVDADDEVRLARALERGMAEHDARSRMASQPTRAEWLASADAVIPNHRSESELKAGVEALAGALIG